MHIVETDALGVVSELMVETDTSGFVAELMVENDEWGVVAELAMPEFTRGRLNGVLW